MKRRKVSSYQKNSFCRYWLKLRGIEKYLYFDKFLLTPFEKVLINEKIFLHLYSSLFVSNIIDLAYDIPMETF